MTILNWGQPDRAITQFAYVVPDLQKAMQDFTHRLNIGPWFTIEGFSGPDWRYRGELSDVVVSLAIAFAGHMCVELIEQKNDVPSVYRDGMKAGKFGFHHFAIFTHDFDNERARYLADGYTDEFSCTVADGARINYLDGPELPGMIEMVELTPGTEGIYTNIYRASFGWDGTDPVRSVF